MPGIGIVVGGTPPATPGFSITNGVSYGPVISVTPGASPFVWQNPENVPVNVMISQGTVTAIELSVDNIAWFNVGALGGQFHLNPGHVLRVTYVLVPTINYLPV
jgi:hypothetical protein